MGDSWRLPIGLILASLVILASCAGPQTLYRVPAGAGEKTVQMTATNFDFKPEEIRARQGEVLLLKVKSRSGTEHNLTVLDPDGRQVIDVDLPPEITTEVRLPLTEAGTYRFHCNKFMHATLGMRGRIEAELPAGRQ